MSEPEGSGGDSARATRRQSLLRAGMVGTAAALGAGVLGAHDAQAGDLSPMRGYDVQGFGASGNGGGDDTGAVQAAIDAAATTGGIVFFPPGTYRVAGIRIATGVHLRGSGIDATILRLSDGADVAVVESAGFGDLTGTDSAGGITSFSIRDLTIDGNKARNKSGSGILIFGFGYELTEIVVHSCAEDGIYSEWGSTGSIGGESHEMEARWNGVRSHTNNGDGVLFKGPHDSQFVNCLAYHNASTGFNLTGVAHGSQLTNLHAWGAEQAIGFKLDALAISCTNCYGDLDGGVGVAITRNECQWIGGRIIGSRSKTAEEVGLMIGSPEVGAAVSGTIVDTYIQNCRGSAVELTPGVDGATGGDGGRNVIKARVFQEANPDDPRGSFAFVVGPVSDSTQIEVTQGVRDTARNQVVIPAFDIRAELSPTPPPAPQTARVFTRLKAGKTQLCVAFADGSVQVVAEGEGGSRS